MEHTVCEADGEGNAFSVHISNMADAIVRRVMGRRGSPVGHLELLLTLDCNHRCDYCFVHGKKADSDMPLRIAQEAVDFLLVSSGPLTSVSMLPFGGEPLVCFDLVQAVVQYAEGAARAHNPSKRMTFSFTTNGTLLDEEKMAFFRDHGIMVLLSLDGDQKTHDRHRHMADGSSSYAALAERLPMIKRYQPWLGTRMTVHPDACEDVLWNFEHLLSIGINQFIIGPASGVGWRSEEWASYEQQMISVLHRYAALARLGTPLRVGMFERDIEGESGSKRDLWGCGAGKGRMAVMPDGSIYACSKLVGVDALRDTHKLGDVWSGITEFQRRGSLFTAGEDGRPKCRECELRDECTGGCPATNYEETGSLFEPSWLDCAQTRLMVRLRQELDRIGEIEPMRPRSLKHIRPIG